MARSSWTNGQLITCMVLILSVLADSNVAQSNEDTAADFDTNPCGPLPFVPNAQRVINLRKPEDYHRSDVTADFFESITYTCNPGYILEGTANVTCNEEYLLYTDLPTCVPNNTCGPAPLVRDGEIVWQSFNRESGPGDKVAYRCTRQVMLTPQNYATCGDDGRWLNSPLCGSPNTYGCGEPPQFWGREIRSRTYTDVRKTVAGDYVVVGCRENRMLEGPSAFQCNGTHWMPQGHTSRCLDAPSTGCGVAPWIPHGQIHNRSFVNESSKNDFVMYECVSGYEMVQRDRMSFCQENGRWTQLPECRKIEACDYPPIIKHGRVYLKDYEKYPKTGDTVSYICYSGYTLVGNARIVCNADLTWSGPTPWCNQTEDAFCPTVPLMANGTVASTTVREGEKPKPGDQAEFKCNPGTHMIGPKLTRCLISLHWSARPLCIPDAPPPPQLTPMEGILPATDPTSRFQSNESCDILPTFDNAVVIAQTFVDNPKPGDIVVFKCDTGYQIVKGSSKSSMCVNNKWMGEIHCQPAPTSCVPPFDIPNTQFLYRSFSGNRAVPGNNMTYSCTYGHVVANTRDVDVENGISKVTARCINGQWNNLPICVSMYINPTERSACYRAPAEVPRATIIGTGYTRPNVYKVGDYAVYQCGPNSTLESAKPNSEFEIENDYRTVPSIAISSCQQNGYWDNLPNCLPKPTVPTTCGAIPRLPEHIIIITAEGVVGSPPNRRLLSRINDYVMLDCDVGYQLSGTADRIICNPDGRWSKPPTCSAVTCGPVPRVPEGAMELHASFKNLSAVGDYILYRCRSGSRLVGGNTRSTCENTARWSAPPVCMPYIPSRQSQDVRTTCTGAPPIPREATLMFASYSEPSDIYTTIRPARITDYVVFSCPHGYSVLRNSTITCQLGGQWSIPSPCVVGSGGRSHGDFRGGKRYEPRCLSGVSREHTSCKASSRDLQMLLPVDADQILDVHNMYRMNVTPPARVSLPKLTWDEELAVTAERWAAQCTTSNDDGRNRAVPQKRWYWVGQNIYASASEVQPSTAINAWAREQFNWAYGVGSTKAGEVVGHYTQIIWEKTMYIGCGMARCNRHRVPLSHVFVCNYGPGGNSARVGHNPYATPYFAATVTDFPMPAAP